MRATDIVRHRRERARRANSRGRRLSRFAAAPVALALLALLVPLLIIGIGSAGLLAFTMSLPDVAALEQLPAQFQPSPAASYLYAWDAPATGETGQPVVIDTITDPRATGAGWLPVGELPTHVKDAFLAGIDPIFLSATPASWTEDLRGWRQSGTVPAPPSPLTAGLARDYLRGGTTGNAPLRLWQDWFLARQIDGRYSREQQLEWAINTAYFGNLAYGIDAAARVYFGKGAAELTTSEAAALSAAARNPSANPFDDAATAEQNRAAILAAMAAAGTITTEDAAAALDAAPPLAAAPGSEAMVPAFARLARRELEAILGSERLLAGGWRVETTLDLALQAQAECVLAAKSGPSTGTAGGPPCPALDSLSPAGGGPASGDARETDARGVVAIHPATGALRALAGDIDFNSARSIGTLAQPFIHLTALSQGYSAAELTMDVPSIYLQDGRPYSPRNADGTHLGPLRLREAMAAARTVPATEVLSWVGADRVMATARALGLEPGDSAVAPDLSLPVAGFPALLLDVGRAFAAIANGGTMAGVALSDELPRLATLQRVTAADGSEFYAYEPATRETLSPELAYLVTDILSDPEARCPSGDCPEWPALPDERRAAFAGGESVAGEFWSVGYTTELLIGVWSGDASAGSIWRGLTAWSVAQTSPVEWSRPDGLRAVEVCAVSGLLPSRRADCPTVREWFVPGTEPSEADDMVREVAVNRETGRLATIFTPPHLIERRTYIDYPPEAAAWAEAAGAEPPPSEYDTIRRIPTRDGGAELAIEPWSVVGRQASPWSVVGSAGGEDFAYYRLAYFPGLLPEAMQTLVAHGETPVESAELGLWDITLVEDGLYTLLLTVVHSDGTFDEVAVPVTVGSD